VLKGSKVVRLIPDQVGRGGVKSASSTQNRIIDTYVTFNATVFMGRWSASMQPWQSGLYSAPYQVGYNATSNAISQALFNFAFISTTNSASSPNNRLLEHIYDVGVSGKENLLMDHAYFNSSGVIGTSALNSSVNFCVPATFLSIRNRAFICWGGYQTTIPITPGSGTTIQVDNIIYDQSSGRNYDIGCRAPLTAPTYTIGGTTTGTTSVTTNSNKVNNATVSGNWSSSTLGINLGGVPYVVQSPGGYVTSFSTGGSVTGTSGTNTITVNGFLFPVNGDWNGLTIHTTDGGNAEDLVIQSYTLGGGNTTVTTKTNLTHNHAAGTYTVIGEELALTTAYTNATTLSQTYTAGSGPLSWTGIGPQYAYAYYDPVTGHVSDVSPILQVTEQNQQGVNVNLTNIAKSVHTQDGYRFSQILIFRTLASQGGISGGVLYPMGNGSGSFNNTVSNGTSGGTTTFLDQYSDSYLLVNSGLQAPLTTNRQPVGPFAHMMYWDGRVWGSPVSDPTALYFSCDSVQCPFGVPEESFPSSNLLRIPAEDGKITGTKLVGAYAIVTTNRYSYYVSGNNELNYRLLRFASTTFGVTDYQMTEFAGDTTDNSASLVYLGGDGKIYMNSPTYGNVSMSDPVQDILWTVLGNNQVQFSSVRMAQINIGTQHFLLVSVPYGSGRNILLYDFDRKVWTLHSPGMALTGTGFGFPFTSFATVYQSTAPGGGTIPADFVMSSQGNIYSWFRPPSQYVSGVDPAFIYTFPMDFGHKGKKRLQQVRLYCNYGTNQESGSSSLKWTVQVTNNENVLPYYGSTYTPKVNQDPQYQLQGGNSLAGSYTGSPFPLDAVDARELVVNLPGDSSNAMIGNRFTIMVNFPTANVSSSPVTQLYKSYELYAVDLVYEDLAEPGDESL